ncbi:MAG: NADH:ubiquinone oxidoreductase [Bacteroidetes bacterium]|nr:NADH:ubiquinone oxidoreductase [Bacteroidota bacterium]
MALSIIKIFPRHGRQYIRDLRKAVIPEGFRGRPVIGKDITPAEEKLALTVCPIAAIQTGPFRLDLGKCEFCMECSFATEGKIRFTNDHRLSTNNRESLIIKVGEDNPIRVDQFMVRKEISSYFRYALKLRQVSAGGDNSTEMELNASGNVNFDMGRYGIEFVASPRHSDGLVITGPISSNMAEALQICYDATPSPKIVVLAGSAAISGGIYENSPVVDRKFLETIKPDLYIPGNPPHPLTFINGILDLTGKK